MPGEVVCPQCATVNPAGAKSCSACGTSLERQPGRTPVRKLTNADIATPRERAAGQRPPLSAAGNPPSGGGARAAGPRPQGAAAAARATGTGAGRSEGTGSRDSLIGRTLQDYVIEERLGVGGMGVVYRATHQLIGKAVAIKVLRPDVVQDERDMDRLLDEARIISSIKNRGIINIFGAGTLEDGRNYLVMELLEGESLEEFMQREGKVPAGDAVVILEQVLSALSAAHDAGVVHRDLKPANVFLVKEGNLSYVKLLDFGLARRKQENVTRIAGTPDYISPEHARGRPAGPPADLYAFGVLCFHMLTGQLPFIGNTPMEVMEKHVHSAPPVPHEVNKAIPKALSELILKLLAKEPGDRPDASQVKADLRAATKQMRTAATMMSLAALEPVSDKKPEAPKALHAQKLAVEAQVKDLGRKVTRRWPFVLGGVVVVWIIGVVVYVSTPPAAPPATTPPVVGKRPQQPNSPRVNPMLAPVVPAVNPSTVDDAGAVAQVLPTPEDPPLETEGEDAGEPVLEENRDAVLDDVAIGEKKRSKRIDVTLEDMQLVMKQDPDRAELYDRAFTRIKGVCDQASTLRQLDDCEDELMKLSLRFYKQ